MRIVFFVLVLFFPMSTAIAKIGTVTNSVSLPAIACTQNISESIHLKLTHKLSQYGKEFVWQADFGLGSRISYFCQVIDVPISRATLPQETTLYGYEGAVYIALWLVDGKGGKRKAFFNRQEIYEMTDVWYGSPKKEQE